MKIRQGFLGILYKHKAIQHQCLDILRQSEYLFNSKVLKNYAQNLQYRSHHCFLFIFKERFFTRIHFFSLNIPLSADVDFLQIETIYLEMN